MEVVEEKQRKASVVLSSEEQEEIVEESQQGLKGDYTNISVLILLYVLQGVPIGLLITIPMILSSLNVPYDKQAIFSFASYPYTMKLLWAPFVDSIYSEKFGRRKSWLIPAQYSIGVAFLIMSPFSDDLIGSKTTPPQIYWLTISMFFIIFLTATQDVAVDAWGLTLLSKRNIHYVASCNTVGMVLGAFSSSTIVLSLESADFCNKWLRSVPQESGILNIQQIFFGCGVLFIISTTVIWIFKHEENAIDPNEKITSVLNTYKVLFKILRLKSVLLFILMQSTHYFSMAFIAATDLKLIEFGVPKETVFALKLPVAISNLILPFLVVKQTKHNPMHYFWGIGIIRQIFYVSKALVVYWTQTFNKPAEGFPSYYYIVVFLIFMVNDIIAHSSSLTMWSYMASIADPNVGGTYMTLLATIANISGRLPLTLALALIDPLTFKNRWIEEQNVTLSFNETLSSFNSTTIPKFVERSETIIDGYLVEATFCVIYGLIWFVCTKGLIWRMQAWPESKWRIKKLEQVEEENELCVQLTNRDKQ